MSVLLIILVGLAAAILLGLEGGFGSFVADTKAVLPAVSETARGLYDFIRSCQHPLILIAIVGAALVLAYRMAKALLVVGAIAALLFLAVTIIPSL
jgi:hypothetical protein